MPPPASVSEAPPFPVAPEVLAVLERLWQHDQAAYLVGGGVRDALLGLPVTDWDVTTDARPEGILALFPGATYQNRFGTVQARGLEITTFRRDHHYADHRRPDSVTFSDDVYEDLARRDLTINAIAWGRRGPESGPRVVDPADGQGDLRARLVRAVGDPARRFDEDALRLLRAVRIAGLLGFTIEPVTWSAMRAHAADVGWVAEERLGSEVRRMLHMAEPSRAFRLLWESGIMAVALPELEALPFDAMGEDRGGAAGSLHGSLASLDEAVSMAPGNERVALAALLTGAGVEAARSMLGRLCFPGRDREAVAALIELTTTEYSPAWGDADVRRYMAHVPPGLLDDLLILRMARARVSETGAAARDREAELLGRVEVERLRGSPLTLADLAIDGRDLRETLGLAEGPSVGLVLDRLLEDVIEEPSLNGRSTLLTRASLVLEELVHGSEDTADQPRIG